MGTVNRVCKEGVDRELLERAVRDVTLELDPYGREFKLDVSTPALMKVFRNEIMNDWGVDDKGWLKVFSAGKNITPGVVRVSQITFTRLQQHETEQDRESTEQGKMEQMIREIANASDDPEERYKRLKEWVKGF